MMKTATALTVLLFSIAASFGSLLPARAATFALNPTTLTFSAMTSGDVVITNMTTDTLRASVRVYGWQQTLDNPELRIATDRVVYFPQILTLFPGSSQRIRVGVLDSPASSERSYRLLVSELPQLRSRARGAAGIEILTRVDIPLFLTASGGNAATLPHISGVSRRGNGVDVVLRNDGNTHVDQSTVEVEGSDAGGRIVWKQSKSAFYVLSHSAISVHVPANGMIKSIQSVRVLWKAHGRSLTSRSFVV